MPATGIFLTVSASCLCTKSAQLADNIYYTHQIAVVVNILISDPSCSTEWSEQDLSTQGETFQGSNGSCALQTSQLTVP